MAYFFPRIAVYDDLDGWNRIPYTGSAEFYNDFGNFNAEITVPKDFVVWATVEYPMMVNDNPLQNRKDVIMLTDHEIFHTMFPFYMGINETKYGWMDEGWATLSEWLVSPLIDPTIVDDYGVAPYGGLAGTEVDMPITTLTSQQSGVSMFLNSYPKPALGYLYIKDMLGDELFLKALHFYIARWQGKPPSPTTFLMR